MIRCCFLLILVACSAQTVAPPEPPARTKKVRSAWRPQVTPPGLRLPDTAEPLGYKLRLDVDPARQQFSGHVDIRVKITASTDVLWLHARELTIQRASLRSGAAASEPLEVVGKGDEMLGFSVGHLLYPGEVTLAFDYTGTLRDDTDGLFRQRADNQWFVYSQGQAVFTRLFVPCFDEPRFKTPWQLSVVTPAANIALANAPVAREQTLADGRKEFTFEELGPLPSYLVALAVGPFTLVDGGRIGTHGTPFRIAVWKSRAGAVTHAAKRVSRLLQELEAYVDQRFPWPKLDFVAVPEFFGAMENVGLVTFEADILFDESEGEYGFPRVAAHELVHQWFGNLVTPAWWDDLWLNEAFASFLGDKVAELAGESREPLLVQQLARVEAMAADAATPLALHRTIRSNASVDDTFDEIAYQKGASVLAMFEAFVDADKFRAAMRELVRTRAHGSITADAFVTAMRAVDAKAADAIGTFVTRPGAPIVDLALACDGSPRVIATARDGAIVPVCVRYPGAGGPVRTCAVVGARTELPLAATACPAWVAGNANGTGYYEAAGSLPRRLGELLPAERMALGADAATAVARGELALRDALALATQLAAHKDPFARLGAVAIVRAIDPIVDDAARPAWQAWLAKRLPRRTTPRGYGAERELALALGELTSIAGVPLDDAKLRKIPAEYLGAAIAGFGRLAGSASPRIVAVLLDARYPASAAVEALTAQLRRGDSRTAAWRALRDRLAAVLARISPRDVRDLVSATSALCTQAARAEVLAAFTPAVASIPDGAATLAATLVAIDRCIARAQTAGDVRRAL